MNSLTARVSVLLVFDMILTLSYVGAREVLANAMYDQQEPGGWVCSCCLIHLLLFDIHLQALDSLKDGP